MASFRDSRASNGTDTMSPPQWLMDAAISRIHDGRLPYELQSRVLAGPGRQQTCALCDHAIETGDMGYEISASSEPDAQRLHFHVACYRAWVKACSALPRSYRRAPAKDAPREL
jgi:hypothetical protein